MSREKEGCGRDWKLWSVTKSSTGDLFQSQREVRDHSLHLTFLYLPSHPPIKKNWETQIPASGSAAAGWHKDKGMELLHRAPELSLWLALPLLLRAPGRALQVLLQKKLPWSSGSSKTALCPRAKSAGLSSSESGQENEPAALRWQLPALPATRSSALSSDITDSATEF